MQSQLPASLRILLIGDDVEYDRLIQQLVAVDAEITVDLVSSHRFWNGIGAVARESADVILLDLSLPNNLGLNALRRAYEQVPGVPIVVLAHGDDEEFSQRARALGAQDVIVKGGVERDGLVRSLRSAVERRRVEQALRESGERFRLLVENAQDLVYRYRLVPTPGFDYISPSSTAVTGYRPEEYYADPRLPFRIVHPEDHDQLITARQSRPRDAPWIQTFRLRQKGGGIIWAEERIIPILDPMGNVVAFEGIIRDITERKQAEAERERLVGQLAAEQRWLRTVIDHSPIGILLLEGEYGERITGNRRVQELFGHPVTPDGGIRAYLQHVFLPGGSPLTPDETSPLRALHGETIRAVERLIRRSDGQTVTVLASAGPIKDEQGKILGAVVVFEDVTSLKESERLREEWTSMVAHDLRQPLSVIEGYIGLLKYELGDDGTQLTHWANSIQASASRLNRMIVDLLDSSQIEAKRLAIEREAVDLPALVRSVVGQFQGMFPTHRMRIVVDEGIPLVEADPGRLVQVLTNLFSNAAKYGYTSTEIEVTVTRRDGTVQVSVSNQGDGIPPEALSRLFQRFRRTNRARQKRIEGIGLGLYISRGIVEAHGGKIWAESTLGETTTFHFTLPVSPRPE